MRMQSSSESGRVAYCLPIGITSSKTKCVRLRNGRSLFNTLNKSLPGRSSMPLEGQFLCCALSVLAIALYKNFPQNVLVSSSFWSPRKRRHGPCNAIIVAIGGKVRFHHTLPFITKPKVAVRLRLRPDGTRSYGIIDTKQQPQQN